NNSNQYKVKAGDTFWDLAKADLGGNASEAEVLARTQQYLAANKGVDPAALQVGSEVTIPGASSSANEIGKFDDVQASLNNYYDGVMDRAVADGSVTNYMLAALGKTAGNLVYDVANDHSAMGMLQAGLNAIVTDGFLDIFEQQFGGAPEVASTEETAEFNSHMQEMYERGSAPEGHELSYREWKWLGKNNTDEDYSFTIDGNMIDVIYNPFSEPGETRTGKPIKPAIVLPFEVDDLMGLGNVSVNPSNGHIFQDKFDFNVQKVSPKDNFINQTITTIRNHLNIKAEKDSMNSSRNSIPFKVNFQYDYDKQ
ncbi:MAG: LysM domain-containing protein, partial [Colwellia sp.]